MSQCVKCGRPLGSGEAGVCRDCRETGPAAGTAALQTAAVQVDSSAAATQRAPEPAEERAAALPRLIVTPALVGACAVVFVAMVVAHVSPTQPTIPQLIRWGADFGPDTLAGQWWRLLTSVFVHIGIVHLAVNMWCLWNLGGLAESVFGRATYTALYLATGVAGAIASVAWNPFVTSAGASGAIFGVAGALIAYFYLAHLPFAREAVKSTLRSLLIFAGLNLFYGFRKTGVDNAAHLGGLVSGLLIGAVLARLASRGEHVERRRYIFTAAAVVLLVACVLLARTRGYVVHLERGRRALEAHQVDPAIAELNKAATQKPNFAATQFLLGQAYAQKGQFAPAEAAYRRAIGLDERFSEARYQLGLALMFEGKAGEAAQVFGELIKREPRSPNGYAGLGTLAALHHDPRSAYKLFAAAAERDPSQPQIFIDMGLAAMQLGAWDEAIHAFGSAVHLDGKNYFAQLGLAEAYKAKGMYKEAEAAYEKAMKLKPSDKK